MSENDTEKIPDRKDYWTYLLKYSSVTNYEVNRPRRFLCTDDRNFLGSPSSQSNAFQNKFDHVKSLCKHFKKVHVKRSKKLLVRFLFPWTNYSNYQMIKKAVLLQTFLGLSRQTREKGSVCTIIILPSTPRKISNESFSLGELSKILNKGSYSS